MQKIEEWLQSLENEAHKFTSYFLFCELKFQQTAVLAIGKDVPNRLRTAVSFYCLQQATSIFGRYQSVLQTICQYVIYKKYVILKYNTTFITFSIGTWELRFIPIMQFSQVEGNILAHWHVIVMDLHILNRLIYFQRRSQSCKKVHF